MLKCMIADDEKIIRETIANLIDWNSLGLRLIGLCKNGLEAFDMIMDENPDISLIDIRMPGLSGLDLIERVHPLDPDIDFIILSGYGEFEYAQKAMRYGVSHYLLKPCSPDQIIAAMSKAIGEHEQRIRLRQLEDTALIRQQLFRTVHELAVILSSHPQRRESIQNELFTLLDAYSDLDLQCAVAVNFLTWLNSELPRSIHLPLTEQLEQLQHSGSSGRLKSILAAYLKLLPDTLCSCHAPKEFILKCILYTREHYSDPCLTLKWIAENFLYMNVDYVSRQFLKQTGEKYSTFLNRIRIEHSKLLLLQRNLPFYEIAMRVGYGNNPQYFNQVFKKITGQTPSAFVQSK